MADLLIRGVIQREKSWFASFFTFVGFLHAALLLNVFEEFLHAYFDVHSNFVGYNICWPKETQITLSLQNNIFTLGLASKREFLGNISSSVSGITLMKEENMIRKL